MKSEITKTEYFKLGKMTLLCLITLDNGYEIVGTATKRLNTEIEEEEARGIAYQRAMYQLRELESVPETRTAGVIPMVTS